MHDPRYTRDLETDLMGDETLREHRARLDAEHDQRASEHRHFWSRRDREDDYTPLCAKPGCSNFDAGDGYSPVHGTTGKAA